MTLKHDYLVKELGILAWTASVQRARLYREGLYKEGNDTRLFQQNLIRHLSSKVIPRYKDQIEEEAHYRQIDDLVEYANRVGDNVLGPRGYKYGVAQKLLNLSLKYHWCLSEIAEPPHCPVDRIIIEKTSYKGKTNWTEIVQRSQYQEIIEDIKRRAGTQSIAMWELSTFRRR